MNESDSDAVPRFKAIARLKINDENTVDVAKERIKVRRCYIPVFQGNQCDEFPSEFNLCVGGNVKHTQQHSIISSVAVHILHHIQLNAELQHRGRIR